MFEVLEGAAFNKERALIERSPDDSSSSLHAQNLNFVSWDVVWGIELRS